MPPQRVFLQMFDPHWKHDALALSPCRFAHPRDHQQGHHNHAVCFYIHSVHSTYSIYVMVLFVSPFRRITISMIFVCFDRVAKACEVRRLFLSEPKMAISRGRTGAQCLRTRQRSIQRLRTSCYGMFGHGRTRCACLTSQALAVWFCARRLAHRVRTLSTTRFEQRIRRTRARSTIVCATFGEAICLVLGLMKR